MTQDEFGDHLDKYMKSIEVGRIDELVYMGPALLLIATKLSSHAWEQAYMAKRRVKETEAKAWAHIAKNKTDPKGKALSQGMINQMVEVDSHVVEAHIAYAKAEQKKKEMEGMTDTLSRTLSLLPGLQGRANILMED